MNKIEFRGKDEKYGHWVYGSLFQNLACTRIIKETAVIYEDGVLDEYSVVDPKTIGQLWIPSLGLKCYGGDLLSAVCSVYSEQKPKERICKVLDTDKGFGISVWYKGEWHAYSSMNFTTAKVIGNIHDNPELLK